MSKRTKPHPVVGVMHHLRQLAQEGNREQFSSYCQEVVRQYGRDNEALMRLARFCQKQGWHAGFELFMLRLAERLPQSEAGIRLTLGQHFIHEGLARGVDHLQAACVAATDKTDEAHMEIVDKALETAVSYLTTRDDWEQMLRRFPDDVQGRLYFDLAAAWGTAQADKAFRAYRRGLRVAPDMWPGDELATVALTHALMLAADDVQGAMDALLWAADYADDPRLESEAAALALEAGNRPEALRLSRLVFQRRPEDLDNLGRLAGLHAESRSWGEVVALAPSIIVAVQRLNPWQRDEHIPAVDLAMEAWLQTGETQQALNALDDLGLDETWQRTWRERLTAEADG